MSRPLSISNRCKLFEEISEEIWYKIINHHRVGVHAPEIGITNEIIEIIRNNVLAYPNIGVWANNGYNEIINGSDIDIFVETSIGNYVWYALQAKVLMLNGKYTSMSTLRDGEYQWDKLRRLVANSGCISKYLFYNGVDGYKYTGYDNCQRQFDEEQFGCSLVELDDVERISLLSTPKFLDFHPDLAQPWRIITCCWFYPPKDKTIYYTPMQIKKSLEYYPESFGNSSIKETNDETKNLNDLGIDAINKLSSLIDRSPFYRVVIRNTASLNLDRKLFVT